MVHATTCCAHMCKIEEASCPVLTGEVKQVHPCACKEANSCCPICTLYPIDHLTTDES